MKKYLFYLIFLFTYSNIAFSVELPFHGFLEYGAGSRIINNNYKNDDILFNESRLQLEFSKDADIASFNFKADLYNDKYLDKSGIDIREANVTLFPSDLWELKAGRQVLTWGTGDLVFANDLFPKDWQSFFIGRDDEYLKYPEDAIKTSVFTDYGDFNLIIVPTFSPDIYINGERMSYWGMSGLTGSNFQDQHPDNTLSNAEYHFRWAKTIKSVEYALYAYKGFFKRPLGYDISVNKGIFPRLAEYGFSLRSQLFGGIANLEMGYYDSLDDSKGNDPFKENSILKTIIGFEKEIVKNFTASVQYFSEWMQNYNNYKNSMLAYSMPILKKENHDWITLRMRYQARKQTLIYSWFSYYSPAEKDWYIQPKITYKMSDQITLAAGGNIFTGKNDYTFFGQLKNNDNIYFRIRYSY